jgi:C4-dicarboxylate-specific signal transduction histidine kinase
LRRTARVVDLNEVVGASTWALRHRLGNETRLVVEPSTTPCRVVGDSGELEQVVLDLAANASRGARSSLDGLRIATSVADVGSGDEGAEGDITWRRYVVLTVSGAGVGLTHDADAHVDLRPEPLPTGQAEHEKAAGLTTAARIISHCGGRLRSDIRPGGGTTLTVLLPEGGSALSVAS